MNEVFVFGKLVRLQNAVTDAVLTNLRDTLAVVPTQHLLRIRQIDVLPPLMLGSDPNYAGGGSGLGYPRLSELCFSSRHRPNNFPRNRTLLHEIGHILDHAHDCLRNLTPEHQATLRAIRIPTGARTHGAGEHYAIAYQQVMTGSASEAVRAAVLSSRAFSGVDTVRL
ncbi:MAG: hypothetical protein EON92_12090 [Burkholderiales bacterium]|nr:MAG: hypothetical protein EON92_12090 [Burkholderiales bacterium]